MYISGVIISVTARLFNETKKKKKRGKKRKEKIGNFTVTEEKSR